MQREALERRHAWFAGMACLALAFALAACSGSGAGSNQGPMWEDGGRTDPGAGDLVGGDSGDTADARREPAAEEAEGESERLATRPELSAELRAAVPPDAAAMEAPPALAPDEPLALDPEAYDAAPPWDEDGAAGDDGRAEPEPGLRHRYPRPPRRPAAPPEAMFFRDYGSNPWVDTWEDDLSTFALDVDTGAYSLARRYIEEGHLPPPEAVRVEEFVNAFEQGYRPPRDGDFGIHLDGAPAPFGQEGETLLRVGIQGRSVREAARRDATLTFVIDVSGSMEEGERLETVKDALGLLVDRMGPGDEIGIVAYSDSAWTVLPTTRATEKRRIRAAIAELYPQASTNAEAGLSLGYDLADAAYRRGATNRVILCSDGVANVGATGPEAILERIGRSLRRGISLTTIGVGMGNYNDAMMEQLADQGDGAYHYIADQAEAERIFQAELTGTLELIARDAKVQVAFNPAAVQAYRLIGYENRDLRDRDFREDRVDAGEIGAGHSVTALYALWLAPGAEGELATVSLRYREPEGGRVREQAAALQGRDLARRFEDADPHFRFSAALAAFAEALRESPEAPRDWDAMAELAADAAEDLDGGEARDLAALIDRAGRLRVAMGGPIRPWER